ncbi:MAG TPA: hypothetical protein VHK68_00725 [Gemmatimonadales bacterium]|nr:hypothetical protein [Gemmatimonadales bacterium]
MVPCRPLVGGPSPLGCRWVRGRGWVVRFRVRLVVRGVRVVSHGRGWFHSGVVVRRLPSGVAVRLLPAPWARRRSFRLFRAVGG